ncbi:MAG: TFIIB-type zinc ribbon-containing protein [bacterium]
MNNQETNQDFEEVVSYKCKNCGSDLNYDATSGKLICGSCKGEFYVSEFQTFENADFEKIKEKTTISSFNESEVQEFNCDNCGAVLITDAHTASTNCNFCGSPMVISSRLSGKVAPASVLPFKFTNQDAQAAFKKWCRNGLVTPNDFLTEKRIRNIEGLYVPFWLYNLNSQAEGEALCTRVRRYRTSKHNVIETRHYISYRRVTADFEKIPVDASIKMDDNVMDLLEPFNYNELETFNAAYLSGFSTEKYNYTDKDLFSRVENRSDAFIKEYLSDTIRGYDTVNIVRLKTDTKQRDAVYTLLPVYTVSYKYKGKEYNFAMNGQTGKIVGKPPVCISKVVKFALIAFFGVLAISELIYLIVGVLL